MLNAAGTIAALLLLASPALPQDEQEVLDRIKQMMKERAKKKIETAHYEIRAGQLTGGLIREPIEALHALWMDTLKLQPSASRLAVRVHADEHGYKEEVKVSSLAFYDRDTSTLIALVEAGLLNNLAREGTLQILHTSAPKAFAAAPPWLRRGLAMYFGSVDVDGSGKLTMNVITTRENFNNGLALKRLFKDRKAVALRKLLGESEKEFDANVKAREILSWGAVWWLYNAGQSGTAVQRLIAALDAGKTRDEAYVEAFGVGGRVDWMRLDSEFATYWKNLKVEIPDREEGGWLVGETEHYTVRVQKGTRHSKLKWDDKAVLKDMKFKMELLFDKYALAFRFEGKLSKRAVLRLYKNRDAYRRAGGPSDSAAYYNPMTRELVGYEDSDDTGIVFQIFCHEGCHQFFDLAFPGFYDTEDLPMWFSEGLADCFGSSEIVGKELHVFMLSGVATWRIDTIKEACATGQHPSIRDLLEMGEEPFMDDEGGLHYAQSWSFCHFLWNAPNLLGGGGRYKEVVIRLIDGFKAGRPKEEVYGEAFRLGNKALDYDVLETEWRAYVKRLGPKK